MKNIFAKMKESKNLQKTFYLYLAILIVMLIGTWVIVSMFANVSIAAELIDPAEWKIKAYLYGGGISTIFTLLVWVLFAYSEITGMIHQEEVNKKTIKLEGEITVGELKRKLDIE